MIDEFVEIVRVCSGSFVEVVIVTHCQFRCNVIRNPFPHTIGCFVEEFYVVCMEYVFKILFGRNVSFAHSMQKDSLLAFTLLRTVKILISV